jgi:large subunit ribosomal protein L30e
MSMIDVDKAISTAVKTGKVIFGAESAIKNAQTGKAKLIVISANCPAEIRSSIEYYSGLSGMNVVVYKGTSIDLGMVCKKPFMVSALTIKEAGDSDILKLIEHPSVKEEEEEAVFEEFGEEAETVEEEGATREISAEDDEDLGEELND